jgi:hypothetical protein
VMQAAIYCQKSIAPRSASLLPNSVASVCTLSA